MNEAEKPNRYTILANNAGKWQVLKRAAAHHWLVEVPDCGSKRLAVLILDALVRSDDEGSPENIIMTAGGN